MGLRKVIYLYGILINNIGYYIKYDPFSYKSGNKSMGGFHRYIPKEIMCSWLYVSQGWEIAEDIKVIYLHYY